MSSVSSEFVEVEKVWDKRVRNRRNQYKIQWKNHSKSQAQWVDENDCRCPLSIKEYEVRRLDHLIGVQFQPNGLLAAYGGKFFDIGINIIPKDQLLRFWPREAKDFLEKRIRFDMPPAGWPQPKLIEMRPETAFGKPVRAIACTDVKGGIAYLCEWQNGARKILSTAAVSPAIVLPFLDASIRIQDATDVNGDNFRVHFTRRMFNAIQHFGIRNPVVRITRNMHLDKSIILQANQIVGRRTTVDIPFAFRGRPRDAIRGRKRTTENLLVQSVQPNMDGRSLAQAPQAQPSPTTPSPTTPSNTPLKKNDVPKKNTVITYTRPSRPVLRRLTFSSYQSSSSSPFSPSALQPSQAMNGSIGSIDLADANSSASTNSASNTTNPPTDFEQAPADFGQI